MCELERCVLMRSCLEANAFSDFHLRSDYRRNKKEVLVARKREERRFRDAFLLQSLLFSVSLAWMNVSGLEKGKNCYQLTDEQEAACLIKACCFHVHVAQAEKRHQSHSVSCQSERNENLTSQRAVNKIPSEARVPLRARCRSRSEVRRKCEQIARGCWVSPFPRFNLGFKASSGGRSGPNLFCFVLPKSSVFTRQAVPSHFLLHSWSAEFISSLSHLNDFCL